MSGESSPSVPLPSIPAHPPTHACKPKRQSLSRFLHRSPYGERRSRAVAPADGNRTQSLVTRRRRGAGGNELTARRQSSVVHVRTLQRFRLAVGDFMRLLSVELFFVMIVLFYGVFVTVQLTMADDALASYKLAIDVTDVTVGSILLIEIFLKVFAYGLHFLSDVWALFDALVIVVSFVLGVLAAMGTTSSILVKILRLRVILRILRVLVVFERVKQRSKFMNLMHLNKGAITSPVEHVLRVLNELRFHPAIRPSLRDGLDFAIDVIKNNRLYDANAELLAVEGVDDDTQNWLRGEILRGNDMSKVLPDTSAEDEISSNRKRRRSSIGSSSSEEDAMDSRRSSDGRDATSMSSHRHSHQRSFSHSNRGTTMRDLLPAMDSRSNFELQNLLQSVSSWDFDVFRVQIVSGGNALSYIGHHLLRDAPCQALNIESTLLVNFLLEIQSGYIASNPYHNAIHAADVMQTVHYFLIQPELQPFLRPLDRAISLIAAGVHDFMHDGFNNGFHISTASEVALRYNDHAVLENYHVAQSFLVMKNPERNVLGQLSPEDFKYARDMIIQMVLATDMAKHFEDVALFKTNILSAALDEGAVLVRNVGDKKLLLKMILHTCDVSNPAKERETMLRWTDRVVEEFFVQGDMEKQLGLPVSPFMDRDTIVIKKMQVGFADFIVSPLFSVWAQILVNLNTVGYRTLLANREFWASLSDDFKPHMIKDLIRDLQKQRENITQGTIPEEPISPRTRRHVSTLLLGTDDG
ncbi:3 5-cyclic nucleotide phosphodiesterase family protein [Plasmopara halstedii]|uniref:Phosphodiesterase n=1 Tax=Plasmopara halstedii TaxID=4781 RepID=A0A0P1ATJ8_PLAHL|nr:3 5-cyclic nucleotide phosphodiesterase family protein [Plasmopara halstedii]CEG44992.1 3 5-cyclic nucleotide phosphodiesterase family protein [Plasmopara halstedii]|eukprot:XP_024581361.1 3 5-cyclic nucleotide phosphodiesterase family protein [Plasmopara halstedii]